MDKSTPCKGLVAVFALLAMPAGGPHAQVVQSYEVNPEPHFIYFGAKPYEFRPAEERKLVATAKRLVSPDTPLLNVDSYYGYRAVPIGYIEVPIGPGENPPEYITVPRAEFLFGPYNSSDGSFSLDAILCTRSEKGRIWACEPKETWTYFHSVEQRSLVSVGGGVSVEMTKLIAAYEGEHCPLPKAEKKYRTKLDAILSAPHIYLDKKTGYYVRSGGNCAVKLGVKDGKIDWAKQYEFLH